MTAFVVLLTSRVLGGGVGKVKTDRLENWNETAAQIEGMVAAVGEDNVVSILIKRQEGVAE